MDENPDYVTVLPTVDDRKHLFIAAVMTYDKTQDDYIPKRCSNALKLDPALHLAQSWAYALGIETRIVLSGA